MGADILDDVMGRTDRRRDSQSRSSVGVIIPHHTDTGAIVEFVSGVLSQSSLPDEILIIGRETADWDSMCADSPVGIRFIPASGQSWAALCNIGSRNTFSDLLVFAVVGKPWRPDYITSLADRFTEAKQNSLGWSTYNSDPSACDETVLPGCILMSAGPRSSATAMISRQAFETVGGFDEDLESYALDNLFLKMILESYDYSLVYNAGDPQASRSHTLSPTPDAGAFLRFLNKAVPHLPMRESSTSPSLRDVFFLRAFREASGNLRQTIATSDQNSVDAWHAARKKVRALIGSYSTRIMARDRPIISAIVIQSPNVSSTTQLPRCLADQTVQPDEIIVVSSDQVDDAHMVAGHEVTWLHVVWETASAARNVGFAHSHGDLIAFLEDGYEWRPSFLAELLQVAEARTDQEFGWVHVDASSFNPDGSVHRRSLLDPMVPNAAERDVGLWITEGASIALSVALISRAALEAVGGFDTRLAAYDGDDFFIKVARAGFDHSALHRPLVRKLVDETLQAPQVNAPARMAFAQKLLSAFGDVHDCRGFVGTRIAQRFANEVVADLQAALISRNESAIDALASDLKFFDAYLIRSRGAAIPTRAPLITAIVPLYNGGPYITEALESVFAQTRRPDEVIVVDDGSTDDGPDIVARLAENWPIRLLRQKNGGQSAARNHGIRHAHGDLIALLDQDDVWYPDHLAKLLEPFLEDEQAALGWSYSDLDEIDENGNMVCREVIHSYHKDAHPKRDLMACLKEDMFILPSASLIAKQAIAAVGGFNEQLSGYEDDDLFLRLFRAGYQNEFVESALSKWRIYQTSSSFSLRMAASRLIYAQLLLERFPDNPARSRYYVRDVIAPRFFRTMAVDFRRCVLSGSHQQQKITLDHLAFIVKYLRGYRRIPLRFLIIPILRLPAVAHFVMQHRLPVRSFLRGLI